METATPGSASYDIAAMQVDRTAGMSVQEIISKYNCPAWIVYQKTKAGSKVNSNGNRSDQLSRIASINWTKVQNERTHGTTASDLAEKYGVSQSSIFKHTKSVPSGTPKRVSWEQTSTGKRRTAEVRHTAGKKSRTLLRPVIASKAEPGSVQEAFTNAVHALREATQASELSAKAFNLATERFRAAELKFEEVMDVIRG